MASAAGAAAATTCEAGAIASAGAVSGAGMTTLTTGLAPASAAEPADRALAESPLIESPGGLVEGSKLNAATNNAAGATTMRS